MENWTQDNKNHMLEEAMNMYFCSYYMDMESGTFIEIDNKIPEIHALSGSQGVSQLAFERVAEHATKPEHLERFREFTDISTMQERLKNTTYISLQFEGPHVGWVEASLIAGDRDEEGNCKHIIWCLRDIREQKKKEDLLYTNSYIDQLTGLYNRRMYEDNLLEYGMNPTESSLVYISMDVNGLKNANDTLGHDVGDELIKGAAACMKQCLEPYGRVFRIGGDEFAATIFVSAYQLKLIEKDFRETLDNWKGEKIDQISVSMGIVTREEYPDLNVVEMSKIADRRMYNDKQKYYNRNGVDRREQQNAFRALCGLYTKILKVNLTAESFQLIYIDEQERTEQMGYSENIFEWFEALGCIGLIHPDDLEKYKKQTSKSYLTAYFANETEPFNILYKRKIHGEYKIVMMEMIPADDYADDWQNVYLYVKNIDKYL